MSTTRPVRGNRCQPELTLHVGRQIANTRLLEQLTTLVYVGILSIMKAMPLLCRRVVVAADAFVDVVIWRVSEPVPPSTHEFKYRLAYVVGGQRVLLYDNERGKGDHRHTETAEKPYNFSTPDHLMADFEADVARWNHEHGRS